MNEATSKDTWPRTKYGTIDWEFVFEAPDTGLIAMVSESSSMFAIQQCCEFIIDTLFSRDGDEEFRLAYREQMEQTLKVQSTLGADLDTQKNSVIEILRIVKVNRKQRAEDHVAEADDVDSSDADAAAADEPEGPEYNVEDPEGAFIFAVADQFGRRMEVLRKEVNQDGIAGRSLPFAVSQAFARRLDGVVRLQIAPSMISKCRMFVAEAERAQPEDRYNVVVRAMEERTNRETMWDAWRMVWIELTQGQDLPEKPEVEERKGLLGKLKQRAVDAFGEEPLTLEDWEFEVERIKILNEQAKENWEHLKSEDDAYQAPTDTDNRLLMNLFARTAGAMSKQVTAVRQIAEQGGNAGKSFANYAQGKDIDLPLLAAVCQRPQLFLDDGTLKDFMRGFSDGVVRQHYPLVKRFFLDHM